MPGRSFVTNSEGERYQFTGHEFDSETTYDYHGARYYNRELGRYMSVDPWQDKYPSWSTYNYVMGNPLNLIDPTGKGPENIGVDKKGNVVFDDGKDDGNLFLVNDGTDKISSLDELKSNSIQLTKNNVWIGSDQQMVDYIKNQMSFVDNIDPNMFVKKDGNGLNISIANRTKNGLEVSGLYIVGEDSKIKIKVASEFGFGINYIPGSESLFNPYDIRNLLSHEGRHMSQYLRIFHTIGSG